MVIVNEIYLGAKPKTSMQKAEEISEWLGDNLPNNIKEEIEWMKKVKEAYKLMTKSAQKTLGVTKIYE